MLVVAWFEVPIYIRAYVIEQFCPSSCIYSFLWVLTSTYKLKRNRKSLNTLFMMRSISNQATTNMDMDVIKKRISKLSTLW